MTNLLLAPRRFVLASLGLLAFSAIPLAGAQTFSNPAPITINDNAPGSPYPSNIVVSGLAGNVTNLTVDFFGLSHTYPDDIDILLVGPTGANVLLMSDTGGSLDINGVNLTFSDGSPLLPDSTQIVSGTYGPTNYGTGDTFAAPAPGGPYGSALSVFNGTNGNGTWSLYVVDDLGGDTGQMAGGWALNFTAVPEPSTVAILCGGALILALAACRKRCA